MRNRILAGAWVVLVLWVMLTTPFMMPYSMALAWLGFALGALCIGRPTLPALDLNRWDGLTLLVTVPAGAWWLGRLRANVGLDMIEASLFFPDATPFLTRVSADTGLPSHVHDLLVELARIVGGLGGLLVVHTALYAVFCTVVLGLLREAAPGWVARIGTLLIAFNPYVLEQFTEIRAYATYLTAISIGTWCMLLRTSEPGHRAAGWFALALASLDVPIAITLILGLGIRTRIDTGRSQLTERYVLATICLGVGLLPTVVEALGVHDLSITHDANDWSEVSRNMQVSAGLVALSLAVLLRRDPWRWGLPVLVPLGTVMLLLLTDRLRLQPRYLLFITPLVSAVVLRAWRDVHTVLAAFVLLAVHALARLPDGLNWMEHQELGPRSPAVVGVMLAIAIGALIAPTAQAVWHASARGAVVGLSLVFAGFLWRSPMAVVSHGQSNRALFLLKGTQHAPLCVDSPEATPFIRTAILGARHRTWTPLLPLLDDPPWHTTCTPSTVGWRITDRAPTSVGLSCTPHADPLRAGPSWQTWWCDARNPPIDAPPR